MYNEQYWKEKEERRKVREVKPEKKNMFMNIMKMFFSPPEPKGKITVHIRTMKERKMRRQTHKARMRNVLV